MRLIVVAAFLTTTHAFALRAAALRAVPARAISIKQRMSPVALCANKIDPSNDDDDAGLAKEASEAWERAKLSKELDAALADLEFKWAAERLKERAAERLKDEPGRKAFLDSLYKGGQYSDFEEALLQVEETQRAIQELKLEAMGKTVETMELSEMEFFEAIDELLKMDEAARRATAEARKEMSAMDIVAGFDKPFTNQDLLKQATADWAKAHPEVVCKLALLTCETCLSGEDLEKLAAWTNEWTIENVRKAKISLVQARLNLGWWPKLIGGWKD